MNKRLTIADLINKASDKKQKQIEIYIKRLDKTILAVEPDNILIMDSLEIAEKNNKFDGDLNLVYNSIISPNFKDTSLHDAYNITRPVEILNKVFTLGEITNIAKIILEDAHMLDNSCVSIVEDIKN